MKFSDLQFEPTLQAAIDKTGYTECTPIQDEAMPLIVEGRDVSGLAQTGTGKTAAFLIPLMERILRSRPQPPDLSPEQQELVKKRAFPDWRAQNFILILVPTRELAEQVMENIDKFGVASGLRGVAVYGGTSYEKQREGFRSGVEFVAATPGRLLDLYKDNLVDLKQVRAVVFDEADRMFDMGFKDDMKFILQRIPKERQYLVFSATLNFEVLNTAYQFGSEPVELNVSRDQTKAENVKDEIFHVGQEDKPMHLLSLIKRHNPKQAIIFTNFKMNVDRIAMFLLENGLTAMGISSLLSQAQRNKVMEAFKGDNNMNILVATDVAARGLDIKGVDLVINFELPQDAESYVHRIGRTGRAGHTGTAYSLVSDRDVDSLMRIEEYLKNKLVTGFIEEADLVKEYRQMPRGEITPGRVMAEAMNEGRPPRSNGGGGGGPRGGGGGRGRGPRERGPRGDRRDDRGPSSGGPRPHGSGSGPQPRSAGPVGEKRGPRPNGPNGPQANGSGPKPLSASGGPQPVIRPVGSGNGEARRGNGAGPRPNSGHRGPKPRQPSPKTLGSKVKGFFKRLFGE